MQFIFFFCFYIIHLGKHQQELSHSGWGFYHFWYIILKNTCAAPVVSIYSGPKAHNCSDEAAPTVSLETTVTQWKRNRTVRQICHQLIRMRFQLVLNQSLCSSIQNELQLLSSTVFLFVVFWQNKSHISTIMTKFNCDLQVFALNSVSSSHNSCKIYLNLQELHISYCLL